MQNARGIVIWIGIDDTDSTKGMCTTYLATLIIKEFTEYDIIGSPRLVRLNPNVPWKTRGNAAVAIRFGKANRRDHGKKRLAAIVGGKRYYCFEKGADAPVTKDALKRVQKIVEENARFEDKKTNPGIVITDRHPDAAFYKRAVTTILDINDTKKMLKKIGALYKCYKNGRGIIGASAAIAWLPKDRTYEIIAYREKKRWGTPRKVDMRSVIDMDKKFPSTFNNYDYENNRAIIAPHSPCPILFGIRGDRPDVLERAANAIKPNEKRASMVLFESNQGTDDHLVKKAIKDIAPYDSVITSGVVCAKTAEIPGGHVIFSIKGKNSNSKIDCAAYEPTKGFRNIVRELELGDAITVFGGVRQKPLTVNIEKMMIDKLASIHEKAANPMCENCNKRMKSIGKGAGYRCKKCGAKAREEDAEFVSKKRGVKETFYEVPVCARRHLSKPLKRMAV